MTFKMKDPSMTKGTKAHKLALNKGLDKTSKSDGRAGSSAFQKHVNSLKGSSAIKHIVDDNTEHQNEYGDLDSAHDRDNPQTPEEHKGYKNEDLITREDTGPEAGADYNEPDTSMKKKSPYKNYKNPQDYKVFNYGNKPTPVKNKSKKY